MKTEKRIAKALESIDESLKALVQLEMNNQLSGIRREMIETCSGSEFKNIINEPEAAKTHWWSIAR